jgi:hypothetical protein
MTANDSSPLPEGSNDLDGADCDLDFVGKVDMERLLAGGVPDWVPAGDEAELPVANDEDFAALPGWGASGERSDDKAVDGVDDGGGLGVPEPAADARGAESVAEGEPEPVARDAEAVAESEPEPEPELEGRAMMETGGYLDLADGRSNRRLLGAGRLVTSERNGRRRARPPRVAGSAAPRRGLAVPGGWVMLVAALVSTVLVMLGAVLVQRAMSAKNAEAEPPEAVEKAGRKGGGEGAPRGAAGAGRRESRMEGESPPAR